MWVGWHGGIPNDASCVVRGVSPSVAARQVSRGGSDLGAGAGGGRGGVRGAPVVAGLGASPSYVRAGSGAVGF